MPVKRYSKAKGRADKLFSEIVRSLGYCEAKNWDNRPCSKQLQPAHIITRKRSATRTNFRNAFCLCFAHHRYFHDFPRQFSRFISDTWAAEYYDQIYQDSLIPTKLDWKQRASELQNVKDINLHLSEARVMNL